MAEETQVQEPQQTQVENTPVKADPTPQEHLIPKSRFDEVNTKYKEVQGQLDQLLAEREQQEKQA
ncbi:hypothetical protein GJ688_20125, partial [Heliobacillus mobilis]